MSLVQSQDRVSSAWPPHDGVGLAVEWMVAAHTGRRALR